MINFEQYYNEGLGSFVKKMGGDISRGIKKTVRTALNPGTYIAAAGNAIKAAPGVVGAAGKFMKQGPSIAGTAAGIAGAAGGALAKTGEYVKAGWGDQDILISNKPAGGENLDIPTYQNLAASGKIKLSLPAGKTNLSQLAAGDSYSVVNKRTGQSTQYKVTNKQGNTIQVVDAAVMQKKV